MARQVNGTSHKAEKQGGGVGGGPVGNSGGYSGRPGGSKPAGPSEQRAGGAGSNSSNLALAGILALLLGKNGKNGKSSPVRIIIIAVIIFLLLKSCSGGQVATVDTGAVNYSPATTVSTPAPVVTTPAPTPAPVSAPGSIGGSFPSYSGSYGSNTGSYSGSSSAAYTDYSSALSSLLGGYSPVNSGSYSSSGWINGSNCGSLNTSVLQGSRAKFTNLKGNGNDTVTIMVYMCGTDLESQSGMGTADLQEMASATIGSNVNLLVFTGGCKRWQNNIISSSVNQIYKVESGGLRCLEKDAGTSAMTNPDNLSSYIKYCAKNYKADRNMLIFWDHGGGSLTGYGYDDDGRDKLERVYAHCFHTEAALVRLTDFLKDNAEAFCRECERLRDELIRSIQ